MCRQIDTAPLAFSTSQWDAEVSRCSVTNVRKKSDVITIDYNQKGSVEPAKLSPTVPIIID